MAGEDNTEQTGGFVTLPVVTGSSTSGGCCGEPADSSGAVVGGQGDGCCGEPNS
jgi:hypothetical protein